MLQQDIKPIIIVGSGLSGLAAALYLESQGQHCLILEKEARVGGKVQTDLFEDKYLLDHGFQVLLPAYSELKALLPKLDLNLRIFKSGALVNANGLWHKVADPLRHPRHIFSTVSGNYGSLKDKLLVLKLKYFVLNSTDASLLTFGTTDSLEFLRQFGFSEAMIQNFWQPFFSGIFLETELKTRSGFLLFLYKMFAQSPVAVPENGMGQLPLKMVQLLKNTEILLNTEVTDVYSTSIKTKGGKTVLGKAVINTFQKTQHWGSVTTLYYAAPASPIKGAWLFLNSKKQKTLINHIAVMTEVSKTYCTTDEALISVNVVRSNLSSAERTQVDGELEKIFGPIVRTWRFLRAYDIDKALPINLVPGENEWDTPSQQGALLRGRYLAQTALASLT